MTFEKLVWIAPVVGALVLFIFWAIYHQWVASLACLEAAIHFSSRALRELRKNSKSANPGFTRPLQ
jgi:membrane protein implicated in regulation of membrane protease activity